MDLDHPVIEHTWNARSQQPVVVLYVVAVFVGFMALAHFVFHSAEGVKALLLTAIGAVVGLIPSVLTRIEYQLTEAGLAKRPLRTKDPKEFKAVFAWDELSHLLPTKSGFKFYKRVETSNPFLRFLKLHLSGDHSGEFHVEPQDRGRVRAMIDRHGIPTSKPRAVARVGPASRA
jgi:hypothetical protein